MNEFNKLNDIFSFTPPILFTIILKNKSKFLYGLSKYMQIKGKNKTISKAITVCYLYTQNISL